MGFSLYEYEGRAMKPCRKSQNAVSPPEVSLLMKMYGDASTHTWLDDAFGCVARLFRINASVEKAQPSYILGAIHRCTLTIVNVIVVLIELNWLP